MFTALESVRSEVIEWLQGLGYELQRLGDRISRLMTL